MKETKAFVAYNLEIMCARKNRKTWGTDHIMKCSVSQEVFPYCGKIGRYCLRLGLTVGQNCNAVLVQWPMAFHGNFANGKEILRSKDVRTPILLECMHHQDIDVPGLPGGPRPDLAFPRAQCDRIDEKRPWHPWVDRTAKLRPHQEYPILVQRHR
jgi:hypothetical protein